MYKNDIMSLPREWSFQAGTAVSMSTAGENREGSVRDVLGNCGGELAGCGDSLGGSLFSIHSAPVFELNAESSSPKRPSSLVIPTAAAVNTQTVLHVSSPDTVDDDDNLLTISSLTAKPLIAKSRELRNIKAQHNRWKKFQDEALKCTGEDAECASAPDGGYGWVIVFGAFFVQFWVAGLVKSYGVLFVEVMETYPNSSAAVASWIPAILSALCLALGT